jgi:HD-GYP domain-containing protein (c-di-GMP phosphodiesterase class II)
MERILRSRLGANLLLIAASAALPAASVHFLMGEGNAPITGTGHLFFMAIGASVAAVASIALMACGLRTRDGRAVVAGGAFATMTLLLAIHGLATPGVLLGRNGVVAFAGGTALPAGAAILSLAALPVVRRPENVSAIAHTLGALLAALAVTGVVVLFKPGAVPSLPKAGDPDAYIFGAVGLVLFGLIALRAVRTFALTRRTTDLLVVVGAVWLGVALYPALLLAPGGWGWWMGHLLEFLGVALVGIPLALDARRGAPSHPTAGDLPAERLVAEAESFLGGEVRALLHRLDSHDRSTEEHTRRVATLAVMLGERLGLRAGRLRELALAGILHDIGKLSVPHAILAKPRKLTDDEMDVIRLHPVWGDELLAQLGHAKRIRGWVRGHHERLDGSGYPDGLDGSQLDLETRILAVADVYDALVSPRVYRQAWPREDALALLRDGVDTLFDGRCVAELEALTAGTTKPSPATPDVEAMSPPLPLSRAAHQS